MLLLASNIYFYYKHVCLDYIKLLHTYLAYFSLVKGFLYTTYSLQIYIETLFVFTREKLVESNLRLYDYALFITYISYIYYVLSQQHSLNSTLLTALLLSTNRTTIFSLQKSKNSTISFLYLNSFLIYNNLFV